MLFTPAADTVSRAARSEDSITANGIVVIWPACTVSSHSFEWPGASTTDTVSNTAVLNTTSTESVCRAARSERRFFTPSIRCFGTTIGKWLLHEGRIRARLDENWKHKGEEAEGEHFDVVERHY